MCLPAICISSLVKYLIISFAYFKVEFLLSCKSSLCILDTRLLSDVQFVNFFSQS